MRASPHDCWRRIHWADRDTNRLLSEIRGFLASRPHEPVAHLEGRYGWVKMRVHREPPPHWAELVGRVLDGLRAATNYLAYQLLILDTGCDPPPGGQRIEFPIFEDRGLFASRHRLEGLTQQHQNVIEAMQPYHGGHDALWALHELSRAQRHRLLHPVAAVVAGHHHRIEAEGAEVERSWPPLFGPFKDVDIVAWFEVRLTRPTANVELHADIPTDVVLDHPLVAHQSVATVMFSMLREVIKLIDRFGHEFPEPMT